MKPIISKFCGCTTLNTGCQVMAACTIACALLNIFAKHIYWNSKYLPAAITLNGAVMVLTAIFWLGVVRRETFIVRAFVYVYLAYIILCLAKVIAFQVDDYDFVRWRRLRCKEIDFEGLSDVGNLLTLIYGEVVTYSYLVELIVKSRRAKNPKVVV